MKVAFCGVWHVHAYEYCLAAKEYADVVGVYDRDPDRRNAFCKQHGLKEFTDFEELLASDANGVIVTSATSEHAEYIPRIAEAGKDIFSEKVMALSIAECLDIKQAVEKNGVKYVISLFQKYEQRPLTVKKYLTAASWAE